MEGKKILVIEDEEDIGRLIEHNLKKNGYRVQLAGSGEEGLMTFGSFEPDLVVLDLMLPGISGMDVCGVLRKRILTLPIIMLTAKSEEQDVLLGLDKGADDYVTKPFSIRILMAKIRNILSRQEYNGDHSMDQENRIIRKGDLVIDKSRHEVTVGNSPVKLTLSEFNILAALVNRPGWVFSRDQLIDIIRGGDCIVTQRTIDVHVFSLRKKLGTVGSAIESIRGIGYRYSP